MSAPVKALSEGLEVLLSRTITCIERHAGCWLLHAKEEDVHPAGPFDAVVIAVPAPQAMALLPNQAACLRDSVATVQMAPQWSVILQYDAPLDIAFDRATADLPHPLERVVRNTSKPARTGPETWILQACPSWSRSHLDDEPEMVTKVLLEAFQALGVGMPAYSTAHRWRFASCESRLAQSLWDSETGIGLCGDWLQGSDVESAWRSGIHLAETIAFAAP